MTKLVAAFALAASLLVVPGPVRAQSRLLRRSSGSPEPV